MEVTIWIYCEYISQTCLHQTAFFNLTWGNYIMIAVACVFLYLAIAKGFEPLLLVPIAFGMLLVNIYPDIMLHPEDTVKRSRRTSILFLSYWMSGAILPSLIFMGVGAMTDFGPLIANPKSFLLGAAAQFGIYCSIFRGNAYGILRIRQQQLSPLSVVLTARLPSSWQVSCGQTALWDRSQWQHILICHWCRSSSRLS